MSVLLWIDLLGKRAPTELKLLHMQLMVRKWELAQEQLAEWQILGGLLTSVNRVSYAASVSPTSLWPSLPTVCQIEQHFAVRSSAKRKWFWRTACDTQTYRGVKRIWSVSASNRSVPLINLWLPMRRQAKFVPTIAQKVSVVRLSVKSFFVNRSNLRERFERRTARCVIKYRVSVQGYGIVGYIFISIIGSSPIRTYFHQQQLVCGCTWNCIFYTLDVSQHGIVITYSAKSSIKSRLR